MRALKRHPQWIGHLRERRTTGFAVPRPDPEYVILRESGTPVDDLSGSLCKIQDGVRAWHHAVERVKAQHPSWEDFQVNQYIHGKLREHCSVPGCWCHAAIPYWRRPTGKAG